MSHGNHVHTFNPPGVAPPPPNYSHVAVTPVTSSSKLVTLAGQVGTDPSTGEWPSDFVEQVRNAYANVSTCLKAAGASPRDIVHVRHYIVTVTGDPELDKLEIFDRGYKQLWTDFLDREGDGHRPPDTVLGIAALAKRGVLYEVEVSALVNPGN